ncbi:hypothetical protein [Streptomyces albireticuli]|uniref:hypothetical protein n=1 Tax=Streptomyces albireticuli TaxID=1940 RepID=UPI0036C598CF
MLTATVPRGVSAAVVIVHTLAVVYTTGFVWTLQLMDYPMVARLRGEASPAYMEAHNGMFWRVLAPGLVTAGITALLLVLCRPANVPLAVPLVILALLVLIIVLSGAVATPDRLDLAKSFSSATHSHLLNVSWIRTAAFTLWSGIDAWMLWKLVRPDNA